MTCPYGYREYNGGIVVNEIESNIISWIMSVRHRFPSDQALADAMNQMKMLKRGQNWTADDVAEVTRIRPK